MPSKEIPTSIASAKVEATSYLAYDYFVVQGNINNMLPVEQNFVINFINHIELLENALSSWN